jgi:hypothetical protein
MRMSTDDGRYLVAGPRLPKVGSRPVGQEAVRCRWRAEHALPKIANEQIGTRTLPLGSAVFVKSRLAR